MGWRTKFLCTDLCVFDDSVLYHQVFFFFCILFYFFLVCTSKIVEAGWAVVCRLLHVTQVENRIIGTGNGFPSFHFKMVETEYIGWNSYLQLTALYFNIASIVHALKKSQITENLIIFWWITWKMKRRCGCFEYVTHILTKKNFQVNLLTKI